MKHICLISLFLFILTFSACMPQGNSTNENKKNVSTKKRGQVDTRRTSSAKKEIDNSEELAQKYYDENVKHLAETAVNKKPIKNNNLKNNETNANNPFSKTQNKLKDIIDESDRFIDTTYYMLKMENDSTEVLSNVVLAGGNTIDYFEKLIRSFDEDVKKYEDMEMYDCTNFLTYANQFKFNDSLRQKAIYHYADCCVNHNLLDEAIEELENLSKEKINKNIAPLVLSKLGQTYCLKGEKNKAEKIFKRLKKEFPKNPLIQSADCSRI